MPPKYSFRVSYVDTCLDDYLQDHHTRDFECMVGVTPQGQDWERAGEDIYRELVGVWDEKIPEDILENCRKPLVQLCQAAAKDIDWRIIDKDGNRIKQDADAEEIDQDELSHSKAWFLLTWETD